MFTEFIIGRYLFKKHNTRPGKQVGIVFETATPFDTPMLMQELVIWVREVIEDKTLHPLLVIAIFTVVFLEIHPFQDGNGRLSRVLTTLLTYAFRLCICSGYVWDIIRRDQDPKQKIEAMQQAIIQGLESEDINAFIKRMLKTSQVDKL